MKFSPATIKNINWKQFGVNHGEKIALGLVGLIVVMILFMGTRWSPYREKEPNQLISEVDTQSQILAKETWPEAEQEVYTATYNVNTVYDNTYSVVKADEFRYPIGHPMIWPLHRRQEPIEEPTWLRVRELIATPGRFIMELPPPGQLAMTDGALALEEEDDETDPMIRALREQYRPVNQQARGDDGDAGDGGLAGRNFPNGGADTDDGFDGEDGSYSMGAQVNARGQRYVAVRGVFPYREQAEKIMKARHDPTLKNARHLVDIANFEIQRQKAKPGPNPWSDDDQDWATLDQKVALDVLSETVNYAEEIVDYNNIWYTITSPLPMRLVGNWTNPFVGHPKIKTMTQRQLELRRLLDEQLVKMQKEVAEMTQNGVGGFAWAHRNIHGIQSEVAGDGTRRTMLLNNLRKQLMNPEDDAGTFQMPGEVDGMLRSTNETPEYVLFRYFDFDVTPGEAYRYRVRLKLFNPNFGELPDNLVAENVGMGEFRETPWSDPSPVSTRDVLPEDSNYFVGDVLAARTRQEPKARIDLYQWLSEIGTTANKIVEVQVGQLIGHPEVPVDDNGKAKDEKLLVEVLRPYQSFTPEPMEMSTKDAVVDLAAPPMFRTPRGFHAELNVMELKPVSQVLIVNEFGELENRNPIVQSQQHAQAKRVLVYEQEDWEFLKNLKEASMEDEEYYDDAEMEGTEGLITRGRGGRRAGAAGRGNAAGGGAAGVARRATGANPLRLNRPVSGNEP